MSPCERECAMRRLIQLIANYQGPLADVAVIAQALVIVDKLKQ